MIRLYFTSAILLIGLGICQAQNLYDAQWVLGYDISTDLDECFLTNLDFRDDTLRIDTINCIDDFILDGANFSMCDKKGNLLFYTNGCDILNANGRIMDGGDILSPGYIEQEWCSFFGHPIANTVVSLPEPCSDQMYHVFSLDSQPGIILNETIGSSFAPINLYQNVIDISKNNGLGEVVIQDSIVLQDTFSLGHLKATMHANGLDWWVILPEALTNCIYKIQLTQEGISAPTKQCLGHRWNNSSGGSSTFSPDGQYFARFNFQNGLHIMQFNNESGEFFETIDIQFPNDNFPTNSGVSFSPNSRFLYASTTNRLYQFDMEANDIDSSRIVVAEYDGFVNFSSTIFHKSRLARDGKIYIGVFAQHRNLHIIHKPNLKGVECEV